MDDWDRPKVKASWDDEDDDVKDDWDAPDPPAAPKKSWDDEDAATVSTVKKVVPKKKVAKPVKEKTEEQRRQAQINADMNNANDLFGDGLSLDDLSFDSKEDTKAYNERLFFKLNPHNKSPLYFEFLDDLFKSLAKELPDNQVRKLSASLKGIADTKQAEEKALKAKDTKGKKNKLGKIKLETNALNAGYDIFLKDEHQESISAAATPAGNDDDDDDFM